MVQRYVIGDCHGVLQIPCDRKAGDANSMGPWLGRPGPVVGRRGKIYERGQKADLAINFWPMSISLESCISKQQLHRDL